MYKPEDVKIYIDGKEITGFAEVEQRSINGDVSISGTLEVERIKTKESEVYYDVIGAGPVGHPEAIFKKICQQQRWDLLEATPHSIGDCWIFKVQMYKDSFNAYLPSYIKILEEKE